MYQIQREITSIGKRQLRQEYKEDPSMDFFEYEQQSTQLRSYSRGFQRNEMVDADYFTVNNKGQLKFRVKGTSTDFDDSYDYGIFKTKKDKPLQFGTRVETNYVRIKAEIENFQAFIRTSIDAEVTGGIQFVIDL